ncbi:MULTISPECIES: hypothetical protein [Idiomarina]|jgi:hypothetical protein|uniref:hypothetical protein n=1 Tax=Idiomarina TaxID=135575 RepID=UPI000C6A953D|nr:MULTISPECIES: hypothetical protein [Idiomarina]MAO68020.1 hypothetical protein [Idiomarina sp.]MBE91703.1 hypothetical protein [Idiomarina sp.]MBF79772.1 hypothetical protein [Idiomarina sp.]|tara:strand:- start:330 stop:1283 length:954 start_codon:yes stop_codon:yes gene_type:complete
MKKILILITFSVLFIYSKQGLTQTNFEQSSHGISYMNMAGGFHFYGHSTGAFEIIVNEDFTTIGFSDGSFLAISNAEQFILSYNEVIDELNSANFDSDLSKVQISPEAALILQEYEAHMVALDDGGKNDCPTQPLPGQSCEPIEIKSFKQSSHSSLFESTYTTNSSAYCERVQREVQKPYAGHSHLLTCTGTARLSHMAAAMSMIVGCIADRSKIVCNSLVVAFAGSAANLIDADKMCKASYQETIQAADDCDKEVREPRNSSGFKDSNALITGGLSINMLRHNALLQCVRKGNVTITDLDVSVTSSNNSAECSRED